MKSQLSLILLFGNATGGSKNWSGYFSNWNDDKTGTTRPEGIQYGLIADEVLEVIPGAVKRTIHPAEYENNNEFNGKKLSDAVEFNSINYTEMIPILIGAVQEQQTMITIQQKKIEELELRLTLLEKQ